MQNLIRNIKDRVRKRIHRHDPKYHQIDSLTQFDRYPSVFSVCQKECPSPESILSFGCSIGEECFTLAEYFPHASILGVDVNSTSLRTAQQKNQGSQISFQMADDSTLSRPETFDMVFAMSVLCKFGDTKGKDNINHIYPFSQFESQLNSLVHSLKQDGLFVLHNSNYRFHDAACASQFEDVIDESITGTGFVTKFDSSGDKLDDQTYPYCIFRKLSVGHNKGRDTSTA